MPRPEIIFGQWLPDQPDYQNPGLIECLNTYPTGNGYGPFSGLGPAQADIGARCLGAKRLERSDGTLVIVAGSASDLYVIVSGTANASSLSLSLSADTDRWAFEQYGPYVFASTKNGDLYYLTDIDSDVAFSALSATSPKPNYLARIGDFLFTGDMEDIDASDQPYRIRWSQFNNPTGDWTTSIKTQASFVDMPSQYGPVTGLSGGQVGLIFQKFGISRIQYVGGAVAFRKEVIDEERGCPAPNSIVRVGDLTYFLGHDGFCRCNGSQVEVISNRRVWDWFQDSANMGRLEGVQGAIDWPKRCVLWAYYGSDTTTPTGILIYSWEQDRWSHADISVDWLVESTQGGTTLEQLAVTYTDLDAMTISLDSPEFQSKGRIMSAFDSGELKNFTGATLAAVWETGDFQLSPRIRSYVTEVTPLVEAGGFNTQIAVGTKNRAGEAGSYTQYVTQGPHGFCAFNEDGRYFSVKMRRPSGTTWDKCTGVQIEARPSGRG